MILNITSRWALFTYILIVNIDVDIDIHAVSRWHFWSKSSLGYKLGFVYILNVILDGSPVSLRSFITSLNLCFEKLEMLSFNWVHCIEYIPVNRLGAWWVCEGTFVNPSVFEVNHTHQITICHQINYWIRVWPVKSFKKCVNYHLFCLWKLNIAVIYRKEYSKSSKLKSRAAHAWLLFEYRLHLQIVLYTVNCVFSLASETESFSNPTSCVGSQLFLSKFWRKWIISNKLNFSCEIFPLNCGWWNIRKCGTNII